MEVAQTIGLAVLQGVCILALAPLLNGVIKKLKASMQCRRGPSIWQPYRDLAKYLSKDTVVSEHASWVFHFAPYVYWAAVLGAALFVPVLFLPAPLVATGDAILVVGLLALGRFFLALGGLDTGSAFGGMGSSREMTVSSLVEPVLMVALFALALQAGSTNVSALVGWLLERGIAGITPAHLLAAVALLIVVIAETGRVPIDNPDTHLELTMIHEGMLLEYSGKPLAFLIWGALLKQLLVVTLLAQIFFPWGIAGSLGATALALSFGTYLVKLGLVGLLLAVVETSSAKLRIFKVPELLGAAFTASLLAVISLYALR